MTRKATLDFLVIGAQKAGTTSLFKYMESHPRLWMPREKEAEFFSRDDAYARGFQWYLGEYFAEAPADRLWGTVTPQYMCYASAVERIAEHAPGARLVAILRDPVERAYSHYQMSVRRGWEPRSFREAVAAQLTPGGAEEGRERPTETNSYVAWGEYGRVLQRYRSAFPADQLLVLTTLRLAEAPEDMLATVWSHLGVDAHRPENLGVRYHEGGAREKLRWPRRLMDVGPVRQAWRLLPRRLRDPAKYWFEQWNIVRGARAEAGVEPDTRARLMEHFVADAAVLRGLGAEPDWPLA